MGLPINSSTRQKMLKDFLKEDDLHYSISSREFSRSLPRQNFDSTMRELITLELKPAISSPGNAKALVGGRSRATSATMLALQTMVKAVKAIPRTLSKQRNGKAMEKEEDEVKMAVTIKDIIGWTSFPDVAVEDPETPPSPEGCTTAATTTTLWTATSSCSSKGSSWCDSDFTADYSPPWCGNNAESDIIIQAKLGEKFSAMEMEPKKQSQFEEEGDRYCSFSQCTSYAEIQEQESYEAADRAIRLLNEVKASIYPANFKSCNGNVDWLLLDFFRIELSERRFQARFDESGSDNYLVDTAMSWLIGDYDISSYKWGVEGEGSGYIRDMDRGRRRWSESEDEQDEVVEEIEGEVLSLLVDELVEEALLLEA